MNQPTPKITIDYRDSAPSWPVEPRSENAPNVVVVVLDDVGFAQLGCYGSNIKTPNIDKLAANGLKLTNFNTTGICSATRSCLLTGRNHHSNHMGAVAELATGYPGYDFRMPKENGTLAEILLEQGYGTFAIGKWHLTPAEEHTLGAPRVRWPLGRGFERFYGFHGSDTSQYYPDLVCDNHQVAPSKTPEEGYHLSEDLAEKSIEYIRDLHNAAPGKPFFLYFAFGAMHTPLHVPSRYIEKYRGQFNQGWDEWREQVYRRQLESGVLPPGTKLTPRPEWIPAWDTLTADEKLVYARLMEVFAGFLEHSDAQVGRMMAALADMGKLDNTIFIVLSDNGASSEGGLNGMFNNVRYLNGIKESVASLKEKLDTIGGPDSNPHYPYGWAWAGNTPFRRWKQEVHAGGVADPFVIHWPNGFNQAGGIRGQYAHAIDVMPTLLDLLQVKAPETIAGIRQSDIHGISFAHFLHQGSAPSRHDTQYFVIRGCRALYHGRWEAVTYHPRVGLAWDGSDPSRPYSEDKWELYHVEKDFSEHDDLAAQHPELLARLVEMWWVEAGKYDVLPLDNRGVARLSLRKAGAYPITDRQVLYPSAGTIREFGAINLKNRSHTIQVDLHVARSAEEGVILSMGCGYGGYAIFVHEGIPHYVHNYASVTEFVVRGESPLPVGDVTLAFTFEKTGEHCGNGSLHVNGKQVGSAAIGNTVPYYFGGAEMAVGFNPGYAVSRIFREKGRFAFTGTIKKVVIEAQDAAQDRETELGNIALAIQ